MTKIMMFSAKAYETPFFEAANQNYSFDISYQAARLDISSVGIAAGTDVVSCFVLDHVDKRVCQCLADIGIRLIALRCAGFNNIDLQACKAHGITVTHVPAYSPYAVAEFAVGLVLTLNRKYHRAYFHALENDYLLDGLLGFDLHQRVVGVIGAGKIGRVFAKIMLGFGCKVLAYDIEVNDALAEQGVSYVDLDTLLTHSDIISLHCPLNNKTKHIIDNTAFDKMKPGVMLINTGRGALICPRAAIDNLKNKKIGYLGLDVYEEEDNIFFADHQNEPIDDDVFIRLRSFPNVLITGHQAFFTKQAMTNIAKTTLKNVDAFLNHQIENEVKG